MRKLLLYTLAAFMLSSCDNLKKRPAADGGEGTVLKKKKKLLDDEETTGDEASKKKTVPDDGEETPVLKKNYNNDDGTSDKEGKDADYTKGWAQKEETSFMSQCTATAEKHVSPARAKVYCSCMMEKIEKKYPNIIEAGHMSEAEADNLAAQCNR